MLASMKIDGYVSAKGSFANEKLLPEFKQSHQSSGVTFYKIINKLYYTLTVGLRRWRKGFFKFLPFSGDTYFQFEKVDTASTGLLIHVQQIFIDMN